MAGKNHSSAISVLIKLNYTSKLAEVECCQQNNSFECVINVLLSAKLVSEAFCRNFSVNQTSFLVSYKSAILGSTACNCNNSLVPSDIYSVTALSPCVATEPSQNINHTLKKTKGSDWKVVQNKGKSSGVLKCMGSNSVELKNAFSDL